MSAYLFIRSLLPEKRKPTLYSDEQNDGSRLLYLVKNRKVLHEIKMLENFITDKHFREGASYFMTAIKTKENEALYERGTYLLENSRNWSKLKIYLERMTVFSPMTTERRILYAKTLYYLNNNRDADLLIEKVLKSKSQNVSALSLRCKIMIDCGQWNELTETMDEIRKIQPNNPNLLLFSACLYLHTNELENCLTCLKKYSEQDKIDPLYYNSRWYYHYLKGEQILAEDYANKYKNIEATKKLTSFA